MNLSLILILIFISVTQSFFFSKHIFDDSACTTLKPKSGNPQDTIPPYRIRISEYVYQPEISLKVTLIGRHHSDKFKGFYVQARRDGIVDPYGSWQSNSGVELRNCKRTNDAATHSDFTERNEITLIWNPPSINEGNLRIVATIVKDKSTYWLDVTSHVIYWFRSAIATTPFPSTVGQGQYEHQQESLSSELNLFENSCITLKPNIRSEPKNTPSPIIVTSDKTSYSHNTPMKVNLELAIPIRSLRGFILQARQYQSSNSKPLGYFTVDDPTHNIVTKTCESKDDTVYQKRANIFNKVIILWYPPSDLANKIYFLLTVVQDFENYWYKVPSSPILSSTGYSLRQTSNQHSEDLHEDDHDFEHATCSKPCLKKYPIGTGKGVADLIASVKDTLARVERLMHIRCDGPVDCGDVQALGFTNNGIYTILPKGLSLPQDVFCDLENDGGGWLVVARIFTDSLKLLDSTWEEFKNGFGDLKGSFRIGNDLLHHITTNARYEITVQYELSTGVKKLARSSLIKVDDERSKYKLHLGKYGGDIGEILKDANLQVFSTKDRDHTTKQCVSTYKVGFWHPSETCFNFANIVQKVIKISNETGYLESKVRPKNFKLSSHGPSHSSGENPQDCADIQKQGYTKSGLYKIQVSKNSNPINVYCDLITDGGGWTIILRKHFAANSNFSFDQTWNDFKFGFGNPEFDYRLGNEYLHHLTSQKNHEIRYDTFDNQENVIKYGMFGHISVASEALNYRINLQDFSGTDNKIQTLLQLNNMVFSTKDRNNLGSTLNCAEKYHFGNWFIPHVCLPSDLAKLKQNVFPRNENADNVQSESHQQNEEILSQVSSSQQQQHSDNFHHQQSQHSDSFHHQQSQHSDSFHHQQSQHSDSFHHQQSQQNIHSFEALTQKPAKLEKVGKFIFMDLMIRPLNFKLKLEKSKHGGAVKVPSSALPKNCAEYQYKGYDSNGFYVIDLLDSSFEAYCDFHTDGGGWLVFKRMYEANIAEFSKSWSEYQKGFRSGENFFLGLDKVHALTHQDDCEFRVAVTTSSSSPQYSLYTHFAIDDASSMYRLSVNGYSGTIRDIFSQHNGQSFSTKDKDNDGLRENCAEIRGFGGWFGPTKCLEESTRIDKLTDASNIPDVDIKQQLKSFEIRIRRVNYKSEQCCIN